MMNSSFLSTGDKSTNKSISSRQIRQPRLGQAMLGIEQSAAWKRFVLEHGHAPRMEASYKPRKKDSEEERPESTPEQDSKIKSLETLVAKQNEEIVEYQEEMTILQLEKEEILEEVCTLKRKIDELQGEHEVIMSFPKKVTGHTMKKSAFWNFVTFNPFKSVERSSNAE